MGDMGIQGYRYRIQGYGDTVIQVNRDIGIQGYTDTVI